MPFSPKRGTRGEPASPQIIASPLASGTVSIRKPVPAVPMVSSSPAKVRTSSPAQASRHSAISARASIEHAIPPFMSATPRP